MSDYKTIKTLSKKGESESSVHLVENKNTGDRYVIKRIPYLDNPLHRVIFDKEINALIKLNAADNIVRLIDYNYGTNSKTSITEGMIVLEYIEGKTLQDAIFEINNTSERFRIVQQLIIALRYAHENGIIHRDINPKNIMIRNDGWVKLIDFGICKIKGLVQKGTTYQYATNKYAAPEVGYHSENATERSDIYSLGAVIYFLFANREPPLPDDFSATIEKTAGIDISLKQVLQRMTSVDPTNRFENLVDLEVELTPILKKYINSGESFLISVPSHSLDYLRNNALVIAAKNNEQLLKQDIQSNFTDAYIRVEENNKTTTFVFDGINYSMSCIFEKNHFHVTGFRKLDIVYRERNKKISLPVNGKLLFKSAITPSVDTLDSFQLHNRVLSHATDQRSQSNIDAEYEQAYGIWKEFLAAMINAAKKQALRFSYINYQKREGQLAFLLSEDSIFGDESITHETSFIIETIGKNGNEEISIIGTFIGYEDDGMVMLVKQNPNLQDYYNIPASGQYCVNYLEEISQYRKQQAAITDIEHGDVYISGIKGILSGIEKPQSSPFSRVNYIDKMLDSTQQLAVEKIMASNQIALVQGPPGTGKTNVLVEVVRQVLHRNRRYPLSQEKILIVSQSHAAVDKIIEDLDPHIADTRLIRIGKDENLSDLVLKKYSIDSKKTEWNQQIISCSGSELKENLTSMNIQESDFTQYAEACMNVHVNGISKADYDVYQGAIKEFESKYSNPSSSNQIMLLLSQYQWIKLLNETNDLDEYFIRSATIVAGTCSGFISNPSIRGLVFDYVIVDEAAKATYPELLVPLVRAKKVILVGDHLQLPPIIDEDALTKSGSKLTTSELREAGFWKIFDTVGESCKQVLGTQYRMHPCIGSMISNIFYIETPIQNGVTAEDRALDIPYLLNTAMLWLSTSSFSLDIREETKVVTANGGVSYINSKEVDIILNALMIIDAGICKHKYTIGIITPYRGQMELIRQRIKSITYKHILPETNTVDAFQGSQRDIILYSTVRSSTKANIGFLKEHSRINVSFSRARCCLVIVGDMQFLDNPEIIGNRFPQIINYMRENDDYCRFIDWGNKE